MHTNIFFLFFVSSTFCIAQGKSAIDIVGSFYDDSTGLDLPTKVYSVAEEKKKYLGQSQHEEIFNHKYDFVLDYDSGSLIFESPGHQTKSFPLHFYGNFTQNTNTRLSIKTLKLDQKEKHLRYLVFCEPNDPKNKYQILHYYGDILHCKRSLLGSGSQEENGNSENSRYVVQIFTSSGQYLSQVSYKVENGINLVDLTAYPQKIESSVKQYTSVENSTVDVELHKFEKNGIPAVYFEQSKYDLNDDSKATLNEIIEYLKQKEQIRLLVKGYTDGVGDKSLNETLAKYRAQIVANYLTNNGISPNSVDTQWQKLNEITEGQEQLNQYRKVTLTKIR